MSLVTYQPQTLFSSNEFPGQLSTTIITYLIFNFYRLLQQSAWLLVHSCGGAHSDSVLHSGDAHEDPARQRSTVAHGVGGIKSDKAVEVMGGTELSSNTNIYIFYVCTKELELLYIVITYLKRVPHFRG